MANQLASAIAAQLTSTLHDAVNRAALSVAAPSRRASAQPAASAAVRPTASAAAARPAASVAPSRTVAISAAAPWHVASPQMPRRNVVASAMAARLASSMTAQLQKRADELLPPDLVDRLAQEIVKRVELLDERKLASAVVRRLTSASPTSAFDRSVASGLQARRRSPDQ